MTQDDDDTAREINENDSEDLGECTLSSHIEEDDLDNQQEVLHFDQMRRYKTIRTTRVPQPMKQSRADTAIVRTSLPNLRHPAGTIAQPLLKRLKSAINISHVSDILQVLSLPKVGRDQNIPQHKPGRGDHNIAKQQKATFEVAKWFMEPIVFTKTPWQIISVEKNSMIDEAWQLAIDAQDRQRLLAGAPVGALSAWQLPGGVILKINV
jgi:hypothetical protein